jgi:hypothetical protein
MSMEQTCETAISALGSTIKPQDDMAVHLAMEYARALDRDVSQLEKLGPKLLATLESLLMTPKARAAIVKGAPSGSGPVLNPLDELKQRRAARTS